MLIWVKNWLLFSQKPVRTRTENPYPGHEMSSGTQYGCFATLIRFQGASRRATFLVR